MIKTCKINIRASINWPVLVALIAVLLLSSCVKIRLLTYPSDFVWLDEWEVKGTMQALYQSMQRLDSILGSENQNDGASSAKHFQNDVITELKRLEIIATSVISGTSSDTEGNIPATNHLLIDEHMNDFIDQVAQARIRAEAIPPRYFKAGQLVGECNACHRKR